MTDAPLVPVNPAQAAIARANGWTVYSTTVSSVVELADPNYTKVNPNGPTPPPVPVPTPPPTTQYSVTYSAPGVAIPSLSLAVGATFTVHAAPAAPSGEGFRSWGDGQHTYAPGSSYTMPAANVTFTAIFGVGPAPTPTPTPTPTPVPTPTPTGKPGVLVLMMEN